MIAEYELKRESDERLYVSSDKDSVCPPHFHRKIELMYIQEGEKEVVLDTKTIKLSQDQIFIADSYTMHSYKESENGKQIVVVIPNHMLKDYYLIYSNKQFADNVIKDENYCREIKQLFIGLSKRESNPLLNQGRIDVILGKIVEKVGVIEKEEIFDQNIIEEVLAYINEHYQEEIDLESLANYFGYSKYYFSRMFNGFLHTNISSYLAMVRLQAAIEILKKGGTVSDAALEAGFSSIQTFYRAAKKNYSYNKIKDLTKIESKIKQ